MYAIIKTGGKQYRVKPNEVLDVEKLGGEQGETITLDDVLAVQDADKFVVGHPRVKGASVEAEVVEHGRGEKIIVFKYKPKKGYRRKQGHRQPYTRIKIVKINPGDITADTETAKEPAAEEQEAAEA